MQPVLLLMDFQQGVVESIDGDAVVAAARRALDAARAHRVPGIFVRVGFRPGYPEVGENSLFAPMRSSGDRLTQDSPSTQIDSRLQPHADEPVVLKRRVSAFSGSDLGVLLRAIGTDTLVLAGLATSGVVLSTLRQASDLDYRITVLSDACADRDPEVHRVLMDKVFPRQSTVTTTDEWIEGLSVHR